MKKRDFIERVAEKAELTRATAAKTVEAIFDAAEGAIVEAVRAGESISLPGFGKFRSKTRGPRRGRNPRTGQEIDIPERTVMSFSPGRGVTDTLAGKRTARRKSAAKGATKRAGAKTAGRSAAKAASKGPAKRAGAKAAGSKTAAGGATKRAGAKSAAKGAARSAAKGAARGASKSAAKGAAKRAGAKTAGRSAAKGAGRTGGQR